MHACICIRTYVCGCIRIYAILCTHLICMDQRTYICTAPCTRLTYVNWHTWLYKERDTCRVCACIYVGVVQSWCDANHVNSICTKLQKPKSTTVHMYIHTPLKIYTYMRRKSGRARAESRNHETWKSTRLENRKWKAEKKVKQKKAIAAQTSQIFVPQYACWYQNWICHLPQMIFTRLDFPISVLLCSACSLNIKMQICFPCRYLAAVSPEGRARGRTCQKYNLSKTCLFTLFAIFLRICSQKRMCHVADFENFWRGSVPRFESRTLSSLCGVGMGLDSQLLAGGRVNFFCIT